jgi:hypothetical protein
LELHWNGLPLPYRVFEKDQRVVHATVVENKRLTEAMAMAMVQTLQAQAQPAPKVKTNSEKDGYVSNGRKPGKRRTRLTARSQSPGAWSQRPSPMRR